MTNKMYKEMAVVIRAQVEGMKVVEMRKVAVKYGIKNASHFKRVELVEELFDKMVAVKKAEIEAEEQAKKEAAKAAKKANKRYKAAKVGTEDVAALVEEMLNKTEEQFKLINLFDVNRKVLIELMKQLHCELWYRTYDKPTMVAKINTVVFAA